MSDNGVLPTGFKLKNWSIDRKLGSGACSDVYLVHPTNDHTSTFAMKLSPLSAPISTQTKGKRKKKKTQVQRNADALFSEYIMYQSMRQHPIIDGVPYLPEAAYGEDRGYRFLVMQRLGRSLKDIQREYGRVKEKTVARIGLELLDIIQEIHEKKIILVDIKPDNFMLNYGEENKIYCVDFGIAEKYITFKREHKEHKVGNIMGTPTFLSLACHQGNTPSRRDDLESLFYVLLYLLRGNLPWENATSDQHGARLKTETSVDDLCKGIAKQWSEVIKKIRECSFEETPNYTFFKEQLAKVYTPNVFNVPYEWPSLGKGTLKDKKTEKEYGTKKNIPKDKDNDISKETLQVERIETMQSTDRSKSESKSTIFSKPSNKRSSPSAFQIAAKSRKTIKRTNHASPITLRRSKRLEEMSKSICDEEMSKSHTRKGIDSFVPGDPTEITKAIKYTAISEKSNTKARIADAKERVILKRIE